jgi:MFS family permease
MGPDLNRTGLVVGLGLAAGLALLALGFAARQLRDRSRRRHGADLDVHDRAYYHAQDRRRLIGSALMILMAAAMVGGLLINPRLDRIAAQWFVALWSGVLAGVLILLALAMADWWALRAFARRHREALVEEARQLARDRREAERQAAAPAPRPPGASGNGHPSTPS